jgi:hypothetical protein
MEPSMNLATLLPHFPHIDFRSRHARPASQATAIVLPDRRTMARHAIMALENRPLQLRVLRGWVWITRDGCPADIVLGVAEVFEQRPGGRVLVQALEEAELVIADSGARAHNA